MNTLYFHNPGDLDPMAFQVMGASVKDDEAIGQFGTGLKYAIAGLLRTNHTITIKSGSDEYHFGLVDATLRGKKFKQVTCNGSPLAYTTEYGQKWEVWQLYRELLSNALDEGGEVSETPVQDDTVITVTGSPIMEAHSNRYHYFIDPNRKPLVTTRELDIYSGPSNGVYYKGVKVQEQETYLYTYNFKSCADIDLTEDRTVRYGLFVYDLIANTIANISNKEILGNIIGNDSNSEKNLSFAANAPASDTLLDLLEDRFLQCPNFNCQIGLRSLYTNNRGELKRDKLQLTNRQKRMVERAKEFLNNIGYEITAPIVLVEAKGDSLFGTAEDGVISLTPKSFEHGCNELAQTLLEEHAHIATGYKDMTRELQQWLFRQVVLQGEERLEVIL